MLQRLAQMRRHGVMTCCNSRDLRRYSEGMCLGFVDYGMKACLLHLALTPVAACGRLNRELQLRIQDATP